MSTVPIDINSIHPIPLDDESNRRLVINSPFSVHNIISYGLMVYAKDTGRWAIIQRKHSVEFLLFMKGLYRVTCLPMILSCITTEEGQIIKNCLQSGPEEFIATCKSEIGLIDETGLKYAVTRMAESRLIAVHLLSILKLADNSLKWSWPKGRPWHTEKRDPINCAIREFTEEVEIALPDPIYISQEYITEHVTTLSGRHVESRLWIYIIDQEIPMTEVQSHPEISNRMWADTNTCQQLISGRSTIFQQVVEIIKTLN